MPAQSTGESTHLITAEVIADAAHHIVGDTQNPAAVLLGDDPPGAVLALGRESEVASHPAAEHAQHLRLGRSVVMPALVNAHTHLDLSRVGPQPHDPTGSFVPWVNMIRGRRPTAVRLIQEAVELGVGLSLAGGVAAVGDVAGAPGGVPSLVAARAFRESGLAGVSFIEFFAIGRTERERLAAFVSLMEAALGEFAPGDHRLGVQPHAPNTVSTWGYAEAARFAAQHGLPVMTHLAESADEHRFVAEAAGGQRGLLEGLGLWTAELESSLGAGLSPVEHLADLLSGSDLTAVHVNDCSDDDLAILARRRTSVVYCPRASDYFGAPRCFGPHRYRDMLDAGLPVALGTDSIVNLPPGTDRLSTLDEMRHLFRRDGTEPSRLLRMATVNGAETLGMPSRCVTLGEGGTPLGLIALPMRDRDPPEAALGGVLTSDAAPSWVWRRRGAPISG